MYKYINGKIEGENIVNKHNNHVIIRPGSIYGYDGRVGSRMKDLLSIAGSFDIELNETGLEQAEEMNLGVWQGLSWQEIHQLLKLIFSFKDIKER